LKLGLNDVLRRMVCQMLLSDQFLHQDLHPGNIRLTINSVDCTLPSCFEGLPSGTLRHALQRALMLQPYGQAPFEVHLIDAGIATRINPTKGSHLLTTVCHSLCGQAESAGGALLRLHEDSGRADAAVDRKEFADSSGRFCVASTSWSPDWRDFGFDSESEYRQAGITDYFGCMANAFSKHRIHMDPDLWPVISALGLLDGIIEPLRG